MNHTIITFLMSIKPKFPTENIPGGDIIQPHNISSQILPRDNKVTRTQGW